MDTIILVIHLLLAIALVGSVLLQRSEGGALGIGGSGGGMGGFMTGRAAGDLLTRTTAILAACFMATSIILAIMANAGREQTSILDQLGGGTSAPTAPAAPSAPTAPQAPKPN